MRRRVRGFFVRPRIFGCGSAALRYPASELSSWCLTLHERTTPSLMVGGLITLAGVILVTNLDPSL
ncbi:MAG: hypothetical protein P4N24_12210, partial [Acidobacteriota bacterium]|nr:hypothetical protein [Acidobacteriota bacterium]